MGGFVYKKMIISEDVQSVLLILQTKVAWIEFPEVFSDRKSAQLLRQTKNNAPIFWNFNAT